MVRWRLLATGAAAAAMLACGGSLSGGDRGDATGDDAAPAVDGGGDGADASVSDATAKDGRADGAPDSAWLHPGHGDSSAGGAAGDASGVGDAGGPDAVSDAWNGGDSSLLCGRACPAGLVLCENTCGLPACAPSCPSVSYCVAPNAAVSVCTDAGCAPVQCKPGFADCDGQPGNGCEADLESQSTCGACGHACLPDQACLGAGQCQQTCAGGTSQWTCGFRCADLTSDPHDCGSCGVSCSGADGAGILGSCVAGQCVPSCAPGLTSCGSTCNDLQNDPANCGACGNKCSAPTNGRALCAGGQCQAGCPVGWTVSGGACVAPTATTQWLATGGAAPEDLAVDGTNVYWTDPVSGTVSSVPLTGGTVSVLATGQATPWRIAVDSTDVYWTNNGGNEVMHAPKDGSGTPTVLAQALQPWGVALIGGTLYWSDTGADDAGNTSVYSVPVGGGTPSAVFGIPPPPPQRGAEPIAYDLVGDGAHVVFAARACCADTSWIVRSYWLIDSNGVQNLGNTEYGPEPIWIGIDADYYYVWPAGPGCETYDKSDPKVTGWVSLSNLSYTPPGVGDGCALYFVPTTGIEMLVHGTNLPALIVPSTTVNRIATYAGYVYWTDTTGAIGRAAVP